MASNKQNNPKYRIEVHKKIFMDPNLIQAQKTMMIYFEELSFNNQEKEQDYAFVKPVESEYQGSAFEKKLQMPWNQVELYFQWLVQNSYLVKEGEQYRIADPFPKIDF